jgi:predicted transcriptional regulator of viral defense system
MVAIRCQNRTENGTVAPVTYRQQLRELAYDTHGVVTTKDAAEIGVPAVELRKLARRGALEKIGHGVYRMLEAPVTGLNEFAEAVALAGEDAVLADESVLAALRLCPVSLRQIRVASPHRVRAALPMTVKVVQRAVPSQDRGDVEGIPAMSVAAAILGSRGRLMRARLEEATRNAARQGLLGPREEVEVLAELTHQ